MTASPINADGSVTIASRADLAYNRPAPFGSLRAIAAAVWNVVATDRGPEHEGDTRVTAAPGLTEITVLVEVHTLWLRAKRRRQLEAAARAAADVVVLTGSTPRVTVRGVWRMPPRP